MSKPHYDAQRHTVGLFLITCVFSLMRQTVRSPLADLLALSFQNCFLYPCPEENGKGPWLLTWTRHGYSLREVLMSSFLNYVVTALLGNLPKNPQELKGNGEIESNYPDLMR